MKIVELKEEQYDMWDDFCLNSDEAWFWHTVRWSKYCVTYRKSVRETKDYSFFVRDDSGVLAICPLFMEKCEEKDGNIHIKIGAAGSGGLMIVPALRSDLGDDRREKILRLVFDHIDSLAKENRAVCAHFRMTPLAPRHTPFNWLLKYGCLDSSVNTQIIDLNLPQDRLWSALRKGHKYDTNRGKKNYDINIYDRTNADKEVFDQYRLLHHKASGRITRPVETFEMMYDWILSGNGMLCGVSKNGVFAGFSYLILYKDGAYYGSASDDPDFETDVPISHVIQWSVIQWLKERGYKKYEIGQQQFGPQIYDIPSSKELSISFFKRGFGGMTVPCYLGNKYYDKDFMKTELENNLQKLTARYQV